MLQKMADLLSREKIVAVDTESNSLFAYNERVCLIQISVQGKDYLVDPLSIADLSPLSPIFSNPKIEKVFHAAEYDLIVLTRDFGFTFANLFDTMVAARILGKSAVGLGAILENDFGVHLNKRYQRANWGKRPLPDEMLAYARLDSHYLIALRNKLVKELKSANRWQLAVEDFERACNVNNPPTVRDRKDCWRINGVRDLEPLQVSVLKELCSFRDEIAQKVDRPLFKVFNNRVLLEIAQRSPNKLAELKKIPGLGQKQINLYGKSMLHAVDKGLKSGPSYPQRKQRPEEDFLERVDRLRKWRKDAARDFGVESDIVLPRNIMFAIAKMNPTNKNELNTVMNAIPWRMAKFGEDILSSIGP